eukprot:10390453-Alexandrium_andersonii.AAC.1
MLAGWAAALRARRASGHPPTPSERQGGGEIPAGSANGASRGRPPRGCARRPFRQPTQSVRGCLHCAPVCAVARPSGGSLRRLLGHRH